jgi:putative transposase
VPGTETWPTQTSGRSGHLAGRPSLLDPESVPRSPRDLAPGIQHVGVSAAGAVPYFQDDLDRAIWLRLFVSTISRYRWRGIAVCLLTTHWHAIVETPDSSLALGMHRLVGGYSKRFNERHARSGYLVRGRYWSRRKDSPVALLAAFRYVARNPIVAGLANRPEDWRWSSFGATVGASDVWGFVDAADVLGEFGATRAAQIRGLRRFVEAD